MGRQSGGTSLDRALDELYGASPAEFTERRDALAKRLKAAGDAGASAEVKERRKPTQLAYVLNQLARRHPEELADLVDVGRELARAQRKALRGEAGGDLRDAIARQRRVVGALTTSTAALMKELGVSVTGHLDEIASALQAALVDPAVGAELEEGRFEKVPAPAAGFPGATPAEETADAGERTSEARRARAHANGRAKENANGSAKAHADERAKENGSVEEKRRAKGEEREREADERKEKERAARKAAAESAASEAAELARAADAAERDADGHAAQAKKLDGDARSLAAEEKRLAAEAKRLAADRKRIGHQAAVARRKADRAASEAAAVGKRASAARAEAERAARQARTAESRV